MSSIYDTLPPAKAAALWICEWIEQRYDDVTPDDDDRKAIEAIIAECFQPKEHSK